MRASSSIPVTLSVPLVVLVLALGEASAQAVPARPKRQSPDAYPPPLAKRVGPTPPPMTFVRVSEVPLPGPLTSEVTRLDDHTARLPVDGGYATLDLAPTLDVRISDGSSPPDGARDGSDPSWVVAENGKYRYTTFDDGLVLAQRHRPKRRKEWKRAWRLRTAASTPGPPLLAGERLFFGALDNQVHAVTSAGGHRLWASDVGARVSNPLSLWQSEVAPNGAPDQPVSVELVLLVPDSGKTLIALDAYDGSRIATLEVPEEESRLIPPALTTADGKIVVAVQNYAPEDASLLVFELAVAEKPSPADERRPTSPPDEGVPYNGSDPSEGPETDRARRP